MAIALKGGLVALKNGQACTTCCDDGSGGPSTICISQSSSCNPVNGCWYIDTSEGADPCKKYEKSVVHAADGHLQVTRLKEHNYSPPTPENPCPLKYCTGETTCSGSYTTTTVESGVQDAVSVCEGGLDDFAGSSHGEMSSTTEEVTTYEEDCSTTTVVTDCFGQSFLQGSFTPCISGAPIEIDCTSDITGPPGCEWSEEYPCVSADTTTVTTNPAPITAYTTFEDEYECDPCTVMGNSCEAFNFDINGSVARQTTTLKVQYHPSVDTTLTVTVKTLTTTYHKVEDPLDSCSKIWELTGGPFEGTVDTYTLFCPANETTTSAGTTVTADSGESISVYAVVQGD